MQIRILPHKSECVANVTFLYFLEIKLNLTKPSKAGFMGMLYCGASTFLIILSLDLCFVNEVQLDVEHAEVIGTICVSSAVSCHPIRHIVFEMPHDYRITADTQCIGLSKSQRGTK